MALSWSARNQPANGMFFVFAGRAYPRVQKGHNTTNIVSADQRNREAFYRDPAIVLSDNDLNAFHGAEKAPLCLEHDTSKVVGYIHHSWIGDDEDRALKIMGRIPLKDANGKEINRDVVADIKAGRYRGLSVGYGNKLSQSRGTRKSNGKIFHEISLVKEPFFANCELSSVSVLATKNPQYLSTDSRQDFEIEIQMSEEIAQEQHQQQQQQQQKDSVPASELLRQADSLKTEAETKGREAAANADTVKQLQAQIAAMQAVNQRFVEKDKAEREAYAKKSQADLDSYLAYFVETGQELTPQKKEAYTKTFLDPDLKAYKEDYMAMQRKTAEVTASKKTFEEESARLIQAEREKAKALEDAMTKTTQVLSRSRAGYAAAMQSTAAPVEHEESRVTEKDIAIKASRRLGEIMCPAPSAVELPWLQDLGYSNDASVTASAGSGGYQRSYRPLKESIPAAPEHKHLYDRSGQVELPNSMRFHNPAFFSLLCQPEVCSVDLRSAGVRASREAKYNTVEENRAEDWEARHMMGGAPQQGVTMLK